MCVRSVFALLSVVGLLAVACGDNQAACVEASEALDPASAVHLLDLSGVTWETNPPTSGAHSAGPRPEGVQEGPIAFATQVSILESGRAIVQYADSVGADDIASLESLAADGVVVAPGLDLPSPVVATAWTWKLTCDSAELEPLRSFAATRASQTPVSD